MTETLTIPAAGVDRGIDKMLHDVFITAIEGGVDYWASVLTYRPDEFTATIRFDNPFDAGLLKQTIDRSTIADAFVRLTQGPVGEGPEQMPERQRHRFLAMLHARLAGLSDDHVDIDYDAGDADNLIQAALFDKIIFG